MIFLFLNRTKPFLGLLHVWPLAAKTASSCFNSLPFQVQDPRCSMKRLCLCFSGSMRHQADTSWNGTFVSCLKMCTVLIRHTDKCQNAAVPHQNIQLFAAFSSTTITLKWCYKHVLFMAEISSSSLAKKAGALDEEQRGFQTVTAPAPPLALRTWPAGSPQVGRESRNKSRAWLMSARRNRKWIKWDSGWQKRREIRGPSSPQHLGSSCWWTGGPRVLSGLDCL